MGTCQQRVGYSATGRKSKRLSQIRRCCALRSTPAKSRACFRPVPLMHCALHAGSSALHVVAAFDVADRERFMLRAPGHACRPARVHTRRHACSASGSVASVHAAATAREHTRRRTDMEPERSGPTGEHRAGDLCAVACTQAGVRCLLYVALPVQSAFAVCCRSHVACCMLHTCCTFGCAERCTL